MDWSPRGRVSNGLNCSRLSIVTMMVIYLNTYPSRHAHEMQVRNTWHCYKRPFHQQANLRNMYRSFFVIAPSIRSSLTESTLRTNHVFHPHPNRYTRVRKILAIGWHDGQVSAWNVMEALQENTSSCACSNQGVHKQSITAMLWNPSGTRLITGDKVRSML